MKQQEEESLLSNKNLVWTQCYQEHKHMALSLEPGWHSQLVSGPLRFYQIHWLEFVHQQSVVPRGWTLVSLVIPWPFLASSIKLLLEFLLTRNCFLDDMILPFSVVLFWNSVSWTIFTVVSTVSKSRVGAREAIKLLSCGILAQFHSGKQRPSLCLTVSLKPAYLINPIVRAGSGLSCYNGGVREVGLNPFNPLKIGCTFCTHTYTIMLSPDIVLCIISVDLGYRTCQDCICHIGRTLFQFHHQFRISHCKFASLDADCYRASLKYLQADFFWEWTEPSGCNVCLDERKPV